MMALYAVAAVYTIVVEGSRPGSASKAKTNILAITTAMHLLAARM
jgi:hypothetical protein